MTPKLDTVADIPRSQAFYQNPCLRLGSSEGGFRRADPLNINVFHSQPDMESGIPALCSSSTILALDSPRLSITLSEAALRGQSPSKGRLNGLRPWLSIFSDYQTHSSPPLDFQD
jgi:hypothetical protein